MVSNSCWGFNVGFSHESPAELQGMAREGVHWEDTVNVLSVDSSSAQGFCSFEFSESQSGGLPLKHMIILFIKEPGWNYLYFYS